MAEARVLTAAERVDMLLDENERLRKIATYRLQEDGDDLAKLLAIRDAPIQERLATLRREAAALESLLATERKALEIAANNMGHAMAEAAELRVQLLLAQTATEEATIRAEQAEREARRPGGMYGLGYLIGVTVGALIVGVVGGAEVVNALMGGRPW